MKSTKPYGSYMIISDLDGTIIPHGGVVSEANKRAIESFRAGAATSASRRAAHQKQRRAI